MADLNAQQLTRRMASAKMIIVVVAIIIAMNVEIQNDQYSFTQQTAAFPELLDLFLKPPFFLLKLVLNSTVLVFWSFLISTDFYSLVFTF